MNSTHTRSNITDDDDSPRQGLPSSTGGQGAECADACWRNWLSFHQYAPGGQRGSGARLPGFQNYSSQTRTCRLATALTVSPTDRHAVRMAARRAASVAPRGLGCGDRPARGRAAYDSFVPSPNVPHAHRSSLSTSVRPPCKQPRAQVVVHWCGVHDFETL